jgi:hypothetical protein
MLPGGIGIDVAKDIDRGIAVLDGCSRLIVDNSERPVEHARIARIDPALIIAASRYGLRYGSAPATGISNDLEVVRLL